MRNTVFTTPILNHALRYVSLLILRCSRWRLVGSLPVERRYVVIGAPHTSNWDFALLLLAAFTLRLNIHWMGKDTLFPKPFKPVVQWMGGIPIDRSQANGTVAQTIEQFKQSEQLVIGIPPEGTRKKVQQWKTGFYHIAVGAQVPILLGFIDAAKKEFGFGPLFYPTGDFEHDMREIQSFYRGKLGIIPENT